MRVADIDWSRLVLHCWPRSQAAVEAAAPSPTSTVRTWYDGTSRSPQVWRTEMRLEERIARAAESQDQGQGRTQSQDGVCVPSAAQGGGRLVRVTIGDEEAHDRVPAAPSSSSSFVRRWLLRVHLLKGASVSCASLGGELLSVRTIGSSTSTSISTSTASLPALMPFAGKGAPPMGAAADAGTIAEIELAHEGRAQSVEIAITAAAAARPGH